MTRCAGVVLAAMAAVSVVVAAQSPSRIGREVAMSRHLKTGEELTMPLAALLAHGRQVFMANWTVEEGGGRPRTTGTGKPLADPTKPLTGERAFNRVSGPDANSCAGCHNLPFTGGGGDVTTNVFEMAQRFDFVAFDRAGATSTGETKRPADRPLSLDTVGNTRSTPGLFGSGYIEMLARQMTRELQATRDAVPAGGKRALVAKGISFGTLARRANGEWDTSRVEGLPPQSLLSAAGAPPSLVVRPWQHSGTSVSIREITNTLLNHHHGIQSVERFGADRDPDGDGVRNEVTVGDVTAAAIYQATLPVPGRVIPNDPAVERAILAGERAFDRIGCAACHVPSLPLDQKAWIYSEPGPHNRTGTQPRTAGRVVEIDLTSDDLPMPRLSVSIDRPGVVMVPAYTDLKLHDITDPADDEAAEPLDVNQPPGSAAFAKGNRRFLTRRLWGVANEPPYFHHGLFTTMRQAILAHAGEALGSRQSFEQLPSSDQDALIEFLKSLQVLPPGTPHLVVDDKFQPKTWPPR